MTGVWILQGNGRDHGGEIILVSEDEGKVKRLCRDLIVEWNPVEEWHSGRGIERHIPEDARTLDLDDFLERYVSAWIESPSIDYMELDTVRDIK